MRGNPSQRICSNLEVVIKGKSEILHWFLKEGASFLKLYSRVRYTPAPPTDEEVKQLAQCLPEEAQDD